MTIAIVWAEAAAPIRWWCTVCDDEGLISNWADTPYDLRRRRLSVAGDVDEVIVSAETAAWMRLTVPAWSAPQMSISRSAFSAFWK